MAVQTTELKERLKLINSILNSDLHGKRIYILGSAEFGPTNEPKLIRSSVGLYNAFGRSGTLINAFHALKYTSKDNYVYLVKTTGEHSKAYLNVNCANGEIIHDAFIITADSSNELYNEIKILVDVEYIAVQYPKELSGTTLYYHYSDYPNIDQLTTAINNDVSKKHIGKVYAYYTVDPSTKTKTAFFPCNTPEVYMYGGQCGLGYNKNLLYNYLDKSYEILESYDIDYIIPIDAFMDDIHPDDQNGQETEYGMKYYQPTKDYLMKDYNGNQLSFFNQLLQFCIKQNIFGVVTHGIIGYNPSYLTYSDYYNQSNEIADMYIACFDYNLKYTQNAFYSFLVSVVGGDVSYNKGTIKDNAYLAYAALCAKTIITSGTTNIPISDSIGLHHELEEEYLSKLADHGIVMFRQSIFYNQPVVYAGVTASQTNEEMKLFCNVRMIQLAISYLNKLFQYYIGSDMTYLITKKIIYEDIDKILSLLRERNVITNYNFTIVPYYNSHEIKVYLNLETSYMIKNVTVCSTINVEFQENEV